MNSFDARDTLRFGDNEYEIFRLDCLEKKGFNVKRLPFSLRVLLENLLRTEDGRSVDAADIEALAWVRRSLEANRNYPMQHFNLAAVLTRLGEIDEARAAAQAGLVLDPKFTIRRYRSSNAWSDNPTYLAGRERQCEGMRLAGLPEE